MATKVLNGLDLTNTRIQNVASPAAGTDAVNRDYVDSRVAGLHWKQSVRAASTDNVDISQLNNGDALDSVNLVTGDRVLLKNQTDKAENGIYVIGATAGTTDRATDADSTDELQAATVFVREGGQGNSAWTQIEDDVEVDEDDLTWEEFGAGGGATYSADGQGIEESSGVFSLELDGSTLSKSASGLRIGSGAAGNGLTESSGVLSVGAGDGIAVASDTVAIDLATNSGLTVSGGELAVASSIAGNGLTLTSGVLAVGQGTGITVGSDTVGINTSTVVRKLAFDSDAGTSTACDITTLNTRDVTVEVYDDATGDTVLCDVTRDSATQVTVSFASSVGAGDYRIVIHG